MAKRPTTRTNEKVSAHRERLRLAGLRPLQIWVPDVHSATFIEAARRQSAAVAASDEAYGDQAFIDDISEERFE